METAGNNSSVPLGSGRPAETTAAGGTAAATRAAPGELTQVPAEPQRRAPAPPPPRPPVSVGTRARGRLPGTLLFLAPATLGLDCALLFAVFKKDAHRSFAGGGAGLGCGRRGRGSRTLDSPLSQCTLGIYFPRKKLGSFSTNLIT